ncbi:hypothetical protein IPP75_03725 [Candidatus Saccharibacteria bacterium]|nr:MAG: hypothetical protein IPP75_03725 [Candidatus Saccharibacteria bacterium]
MAGPLRFGIIRENRQRLLEGGIADSRIEVARLGTANSVGFVAMNEVAKQFEHLRNIRDMQGQVDAIETYEGTPDENR